MIPEDCLPSLKKLNKYLLHFKIIRIFGLYGLVKTQTKNNQYKISNIIRFVPCKIQITINKISIF